MSNNVLRYKGYTACVQCDFESGVLWGKLDGIDDLITFEGDTLAEVRKAFHESVDDYLEYCEKIGKQPEKVYSGSFNVRIPAELHRSAAKRASVEGTTLNQVVTNALESYLRPVYVVDMMSQWQYPVNPVQYAATSTAAEPNRILSPQF